MSQGFVFSLTLFALYTADFPIPDDQTCPLSSTPMIQLSPRSPATPFMQSKDYSSSFPYSRTGVLNGNSKSTPLNPRPLSLPKLNHIPTPNPSSYTTPPSHGALLLNTSAYTLTRNSRGKCISKPPASNFKLHTTPFYQLCSNCFFTKICLQDVCSTHNAFELNELCLVHLTRDDLV